MILPDVQQLSAQRLSYRCAGQGPTVLLIHGFLGSSFSWRHQYAELSAGGWQAIGLDLPGFGDSLRVWEDDHSHIALADACAKAIAQLGVGTVHAVGHSMGAKVALWLARRHPTVVHTLTLVDAAVYGAPGAGLGRLPGAVPVLRWLIHRRWRDAGRFRRDLTRFYGSTVPDAVCADYWRRHQRSRNRDSVVAHLRDAQGPDIQKELPRIQVPVQVIWGGGDAVFPSATAQRLAAALPNVPGGAQVTILPGAGHFPAETAPALFNSALLGFLAAHRR